MLKHFLRHYDKDCFWILSEELRNEANERVGFEAHLSDGRTGLFAHKSHVESEFRIGDYHVDREMIDQLFTEPVLQSIKYPDRLLVLDEIGRMQILSKDFENAIDLLFQSQTPVLATIRHGDEWAERYKKYPGVIVIAVDEINRNQLHQKLLRLF